MRSSFDQPSCVPGPFRLLPAANEIEKALQVAEEEGGVDAVFQVGLPAKPLGHRCWLAGCCWLLLFLLSILSLACKQACGGGTLSSRQLRQWRWLSIFGLFGGDMQVVDRFGQGADFNEMNVATAWCQVAKVRAGGVARSSQPSSAWRSGCGEVTRNRWRLFIRCHDGTLAARMPPPNPVLLGTLAVALAPPCTQAAADRGMSPQEVAEQVHHHPRFQNLVDMALATSCQMTNKELSGGQWEWE